MNLNSKNILASSQLSLFIAAIIAASLIYSTVGAVQKNYDLQKQVDGLEEEVALLELENENLQLGIAYYNTDEFLELEARQKFNKAEPGEKVLLLPKDGDKEDQAQTQGEQEQQEQSNFEQWKFFLFGRHND